ncbi:MAG: competence/damage-inducible protein A [Bacteroidota bacterium]
MNVHIVTIGDEILIGQITDTNSAWMATQLNLHGARICGMSSISDELEDITSTLARLSNQVDVILLTGGLGPTKDDITKKAIAEYYKTGLVFSQATYDRIVQFFEQLGRTTTEAHRQQCFMPQNAELLLNKMGTAPGMWFDENNTVVVSMPGVPYEMKYLMEHEVIPRLKTRFPLQAIAHRTIQTIGEGESRIALRIADFEDNLPKNIKLAYLPNLGRVRLRLSGTGTNQVALEAQLDGLVSQLVPQIEDLVFGYESDTIEAVVGNLLQERQLTLATAESCTGGHIAHQITAISGASAYFMGSIVAYDNAIKQNLLGVSSEILEKDGAVSEACVRAMAVGVRKQMGTDIGISVSGIAGPTGGTPEKPVGTIWMAVSNEQRTVTRKLQIGKNRILNIQYTSNIALNLVRQLVLDRI